MEHIGYLEIPGMEPVFRQAFRSCTSEEDIFEFIQQRTYKIVSLEIENKGYIPSDAINISTRNPQRSAEQMRIINRKHQKIE